MSTPDAAMNAAILCTVIAGHHHSQECCKTMPAMHAPFVQTARRMLHLLTCFCRCAARFSASQVLDSPAEGSYCALPRATCPPSSGSFASSRLINLQSSRGFAGGCASAPLLLWKENNGIFETQDVARGLGCSTGSCALFALRAGGARSCS